MKTMVRVAVTAWSLGVLGLAAVVATAPAAPHLSTASANAAVNRVAAFVLPASPDASPPPEHTESEPWARPMWYPPTPDLEALPLMAEIGPRTGPALRSRSAFVYDLDAGKVLYEKNADNVRPVASITKLVGSLAFMSLSPNLDDEMCVTSAQYPSRSGARSRLSTGDCLRGWDVIGAALVASDNRAAIGLAAAAGADVEDFIAAMNTVSAELGMHHSSWADPSGLEDENLSTARDIARATVAVASHPVLSMVASAPFWDMHREGRQPRRLFSTDRMVGREDLMIEAAKTGYTDTARYCFTTVLQTAEGRRLVVTLLGADGKMTRWADMNRVLSWVGRG
ncbi:MAG: D-alanyl-D-alanine carboxypeptidase [Myxococcales bacterium]|nr:D-alanyl-D-alanine carboxypeptidase [Myxococcales bacterium]